MYTNWTGCSPTLVSIVLVLNLAFAFTPPTHAQTNDPLLSKQEYLKTINVIDAWNGYPEAGTPPKTAIIGPGNALPKHEDLNVEIPQGGQKEAFSAQPPTSTFAGGIMYALTNNYTGIAGINSSPGFNVRGNRFYSYEAGALKDYNDVPNAVYALEIGTAVSKTQNALDKGADILLTPVIIPEDEIQASFSTNLLTSPMTSVPGVDVEVPTILGDLLEAIGGWFLEESQRKAKIRELKAAHTLAAKGERISVAANGPVAIPFDRPATVWPAHLSDYDIVFSVGGTTKEGTSRWSNSALSESGDPEGGTLDIVAPAENVFSTLNSEKPGAPKYGRKSSTAGSAAMAAGVASLLKDINPDLKGDDLRQILRRTADDLPPEGYDKETGYGRLDANAAVDYVENRSISHGTVRSGNVTVVEKNPTFTMIASPWTDLASEKYFPDEKYKVEWTIDLPKGADHDVWVRRGGTDGWSAANPTSGMPDANIEVRSWESEATITTYGYQGEVYDALGRLISSNGYPVRGDDAKVTYTISTKPGTPPPPPLEVSLSGPSVLKSGETGTWTASVSGGSGSTSYDWEYQTPGSNTWSDASGGGTSYSRPFYNNGSRVKGGGVRVSVTKGSETASASSPVSVSPSSPSCGDNVLICSAGLAKSGATAVALQHLQARSDGPETAGLQWTVNQTGPLTSFVVEHRKDSTGTWSPVGSVPIADSVGTDSTGSPAYRFSVEDLPVGSHQFRLTVDTDGTAQAARPSMPVQARPELEGGYRLQSRPNPVREWATVELAVKEAQDVTVAVYDVLGRRVTTLHRGPLPAQETKRLSLDASRAGLSSGTYFVRAEGEDFVTTERLTVVQ